MQSRRTLLHRVTTGSVTLSAIALAGCVDGDDDGGDDDDEPTTDSRDDRPEEEPSDRERDPEDREERDATETLAEIRTDLGTLIDDLHEVVYDQGTSLDDHDVEARIEQLKDDIEAARKEIGSDEQADQQRTLRRFASVLERIVEHMDRAIVGAEWIDETVDRIGTDAFGEMETYAEDAYGEFRTVSRRLDDLRAELDEVRADVEAFDEIDLETVGETIDRVDVVVKTMEGLGDGMRTWVQGYEGFRVSLGDYEAGEYLDAEYGMDRALERFEDASEIFRGTSEDVPADVWDELGPLFVCLADSYADAAWHYGWAAYDMSQGDEESAATEEALAEEALGSCF